MSFRISKYPPIGFVGNDFHGVAPPSIPPPPPAPPNPALIPSYPWVAVSTVPASALIFGKYTLATVATEGMGDILMGYDWGMGQLHMPKPPVIVTPSIILCTLGSSHKYWMPSYAVQEMPTGGAIAMAGPSGTAVAITTCAFIISLQDCIDVGGASCGLVAPLGMGFQVPSVRWVGFSFSDLMAGVISMVGDALAAAVSSKLGSALSNGMGTAGQAAVAAALNAGNNLLQTWLGGVMPSDFGGTAVGYMAAASTILGGPAAIGLAAGNMANAVGGGPRPGDTGGAATDPDRGGGSDGGSSGGSGGAGGAGGGSGAGASPDGGAPSGGAGGAGGGSGGSGGSSGGSGGSESPDGGAPPGGTGS
jgi:hypothetical protein